MIKIFVYGTLRKGELRNFFLQDTDETKFIQEIKTKPKYKLVDMGSFPALLENGDNSIVGELYEVSEFTKKSLDTIEGVPFLFVSKEVELEDGSKVTAYFQPFDKGYPEITSGDWLNKN